MSKVTRGHMLAFGVLTSAGTCFLTNSLWLGSLDSSKFFMCAAGFACLAISMLVLIGEEE